LRRYRDSLSVCGAFAVGQKLAVGIRRPAAALKRTQGATLKRRPRNAKGETFSKSLCQFRLIDEAELA